MLTQGKQGSCLELILNNGEVIYAVIDSENEYNPSSPRLLQVKQQYQISKFNYYLKIFFKF